LAPLQEHTNGQIAKGLALCWGPGAKPLAGSKGGALAPADTQAFAPAATLIRLRGDGQDGGVDQAVSHQADLYLAADPFGLQEGAQGVVAAG
jgi:hypothetical protein